MNLEDDVRRAVEQLQRKEGLGLSAAINELARRGLAQPDRHSEQFEQHVSTMGEPRIPLDDIGAAIETLEGEAHR